MKRFWQFLPLIVASFLIISAASASVVMGVLRSNQGDITTGLVDHYTMDHVDFSGSTLHDVAGGADATLVGSAGTTVGGPLGQGYLFSGGTTFDTTRIVQDDFTICAWFKTTSRGIYTNHWQSMAIYDSEQPGLAQDFSLGLDSNGRLMFGDGSVSQGDFSFSGQSTVNTGLWVLGCATRQKSTGAITLYVNGAPDGSGTGAIGTSLTSNASARIGGGFDGAANFTGTIDDVRVYNRVLSPRDIQTLYSVPVPASIPGLRLWLRADEIPGLSDGSELTAWDDSSGHNNSFTPHPGDSGPTYHTGELGGLPSLMFSTSQSLQNTGLNLNSSWTILYVTRLLGTTNGRTLQGGSNNWLLGTWGTYVNSAYYNNDIHLVSDAADTQWRLYEGTGSRAQAHGTFYVNGRLVAQSSTAFEGPVGLGLNSGAFNGERSGMEVSEVLAYDHPLTQVERVRLEQYLKTKYGLDIVSEKPATAAQVNSVSTDGLVAYWPLDDASTPIRDKSGNGYDGTLGGIFAPATGKINKALYFNGGTLIATTLPLPRSYTKAAWVKLSSCVGANNFISSVDDSGTAFWAPDSFGCKLSAGNQGTWDIVQDSVGLTPGVWYHVAVTYDPDLNGGTLSLYKNGVLVSAATNISPASSPYVQLGGHDNGNNLNGYMDDVRIYNRALSAAEIKKLASFVQTTLNDSTNARFTSGLVGHWSFDGGDINWAAPSVTDSSVSGHNGALVGFSKSSVAAGKDGQALRFNGSNYIAGGDASLLSGNHPRTVSVWVKPDQLPATNEAGVLFNYGTADTDQAFGIGLINIEGVQKVRVFGWGDDYDVTVTLPVHQWTLLVAEYDGSHSNLFVNTTFASGHYPDNSNVRPSLYTVLNQYEIGRNIAGGDYYQGLIDDVRVYNRALAPSEIQALYLL